MVRDEPSWARMHGEGKKKKKNLCINTNESGNQLKVKSQDSNTRKPARESRVLVVPEGPLVARLGKSRQSLGERNSKGKLTRQTSKFRFARDLSLFQDMDLSRYSP